MNKFEIMRRLVCGLLVWNLVLTVSICADKWQERQDRQNQIICNLEAIPPFEIIEEVAND